MAPKIKTKNKRPNLGAANFLTPERPIGPPVVTAGAGAGPGAVGSAGGGGTGLEKSGGTMGAPGTIGGWMFTPGDGGGGIGAGAGPMSGVGGGGGGIG